MHARVRCAEMLCEKGADVNKEDIKGRTCLHLACDAYRENSETSDDMRFEEIVIQLCKRGAAGIKDNAGKAPDCGDSACLAVSAAVDRAWHAGESIRDGLEAKRSARRKAKMDAIFAGKLASHINNASAARSPSWTPEKTTGTSTAAGATTLDAERDVYVLFHVMRRRRRRPNSASPPPKPITFCAR